MPGALGAMTAEVIGDLFLYNASDMRREVLDEAAEEGLIIYPDSQDFQTRMLEKIQTKSSWGVFGSAIVAVLADCDVDVAAHTARNALDNNLVPLLMAGYAVGMAAWTLYDVATTYINEGPEAAAMKLARDGVISLVPYGLGKLGKAGIKALPKETLNKIWNQYCLDNPLVTKMINRFTKSPADHQVVSALEEGLEKTKKAQGRTGKNKKLRELANDDKLGKADRGWLKQEINEVKRGKKAHLRNPPGHDLAHKRGYEAAKGFGYEHSNLQARDLHKLQHKYDKNGKLNKTPK